MHVEGSLTQNLCAGWVLRQRRGAICHKADGAKVRTPGGLWGRCARRQLKAKEAIVDGRLRTDRVLRRRRGKRGYKAAEVGGGARRVGQDRGARHRLLGSPGA